MMPVPLYFDFAATTPVDPGVAKAMMTCLTETGNFGNPASRAHFFGWQAEQSVELARSQIAQLINADVREIVFTSGATESNNLAIKGLFDIQRSLSDEPIHVITSSIEHKAVIDTCDAISKAGALVTYIQPQPNGVIDIADIEAAVTSQTKLVSIMHVNNELGVINDISRIAKLCKKYNILFHVDAAQSIGKIAVDVKALGVDLLSISAHKFYGPKGVGALYVRRAPELNIQAQIHGGGHERGMRSGTLATHQIVGLGAACELADKHIQKDFAHYQTLNGTLSEALAQLAGWHINAEQAERVPNILNICVHDVDGEILLTLLHDIAISSGSACTSASVEPSYVLTAIGLSKSQAHSSLRISFGRATKREDVIQMAKKLKQAVESLRNRH